MTRRRCLAIVLPSVLCIGLTACGDRKETPAPAVPSLATEILADQTLAPVLAKAQALVESGLNAGSGVITAVEQGALAPILVACLIVGFVPRNNCKATNTVKTFAHCR